MMSRSFNNHPLDHPLETHLEVYGGLHSIDSLRVPLMASTYGQELASLGPRFSDYWWEDRDKFKEMFGPDVDPAAHGPYQARTVAIPLLDAQKRAPDLLQFSRLGEHHFVTHHVQHDDHEGEYYRLNNLGDDEAHDVPHRDKTEEIKVEELKLWFDIHKELFGGASSRNHFRYVGEFERGHSWLTRAWDISERMGYLATGVRAAELAFDTEGLSDKEREISKSMARRVVGRHRPIIERTYDVIAITEQVVQASGRAVAQICESYDISREELYASEAA